MPNRDLPFPDGSWFYPGYVVWKGGATAVRHRCRAFSLLNTRLRSLSSLTSPR